MNVNDTIYTYTQRANPRFYLDTGIDLTISSTKNHYKHKKSIYSSCSMFLVWVVCGISAPSFFMYYNLYIFGFVYVSCFPLLFRTIQTRY